MLLLFQFPAGGCGSTQDACIVSEIRQADADVGIVFSIAFVMGKPFPNGVQEEVPGALIPPPMEMTSG